MDKDVKAAHCKQLLEDPYLIEAFEDIRKAIHQTFEELPTLDQETYQMTALGILKLRLQVLDSVWENLEHALREQKYQAYKENGILGELNGREIGSA